MLFLEHKGFNRGRLILSEPGKLNTDRYGLSSAVAQWKTGRDDMQAAESLTLLSQHPIWTWLWMEKRTLEIDGGFLIITGEYCGIFGGATPAVYEACYASSEESIQTHPNFVSTLAGTASNPKNGAIFLDFETGLASSDDTRGVFREFRTTIGTARNPLAGVTSFLSPQVTVRKTQMSLSPVSAVGVGTIQPPGAPVAISGNWLKTGASFIQRGRVYANTEEWRSSGRNQWNEDIYSS